MSGVSVGALSEVLLDPSDDLGSIPGSAVGVGLFDSASEELEFRFIEEEGFSRVFVALVSETVGSTLVVEAQSFRDGGEGAARHVSDLLPGGAVHSHADGAEAFGVDLVLSFSEERVDLFRGRMRL